MRLQENTGYSVEEYQRIFFSSTCHLLKGSGLRTKMKFDNKSQKYTKELDSYEIDVYFEGLGVQVIKFPKTFKLPVSIDDLSKIELIAPEACVINREVYVRAKGIKEV